MRRITEVADCWYDSGSMPVAQWHYPIREPGGLGATAAGRLHLRGHRPDARLVLHAACGQHAALRPAGLQNVICLGHILAEDGSKMSKSKGNVVNPWEVFDAHGADATRWNMYTASPPGNSRRFSVNLVGETVRKFMNTLWNTYSFYVTYANLSDWESRGFGDSSNGDANLTESPSLLDRWVLSELNMLVRDVTEAMENYDVLGATRPIAEFVDSLSNWYVRLSRRRFWDGDAAALATLHEVLVTLSQLLAPHALSSPRRSIRTWSSRSIRTRRQRASEPLACSR
jgi:isoleucyl-tRNA synthetase